MTSFVRPQQTLDAAPPNYHQSDRGGGRGCQFRHERTLRISATLDFTCFLASAVPIFFARSRASARDCVNSSSLSRTWILRFLSASGVPGVAIPNKVFGVDRRGIAIHRGKACTGCAYCNMHSVIEEVLYCSDFLPFCYHNNPFEL
eukprot:17267-Rhodomonas_salina.2